MSIKISTEKIVVRGKQLRKITGIELLEEKHLPEEYTDSGEFMSAYNNGISYQHPDQTKTTHTQTTNYLRVGETLSDESLQHCLENIRRCGNRLQKINARLKKENANWHGTEIFVI